MSISASSIEGEEINILGKSEMETDVEEALEVAAGLRLKSESFSRQTPGHHDVAVTRKTILLFLESLDAELTVGELREHLDQ